METSTPSSLTNSQTTSQPLVQSPPPPPPSAEAPLVELLEKDITTLSPLELEQFAARLAQMTNHVALHAALRGKKAKTASSEGDEPASARKVDAMEAQLDDLFSK